MGSGINRLFPRTAIPSGIGNRVRDARLARGWSQEQLARYVQVDRRTILRLEHGSHRPTSHLVHALEERLALVQLVPGWRDPALPGAPSFGPRLRLARLARGLTQVAAARAAGVSPATLSRFEREMGDTPMIVDDGSMINDGYAAALGFADAQDMEEYCLSASPRLWLDQLNAADG
jgi:transcriptional regulator with XRE-family HTH domain